MANTNFRASRLLAASGLIVALGSFAACGGDDPVPDPTADIQFFHAADELGNIDIEVNGDIVEVSPSELSDETSTDPGEVEINIRNSGAAANLSEQTFTLTEGLHVYIVAGSSTDATLGAIEVGQNPPELEEDQRSMQFVSVLREGANVDIYVGSEATPANVVRFGQSEFFITDDDTTDVSIYNAGADRAVDQPLLESEVMLEAGTTNLIMMKRTSVLELEIVEL